MKEIDKNSNRKCWLKIIIKAFGAERWQIWRVRQKDQGRHAFENMQIQEVNAIQI